MLVDRYVASNAAYGAARLHQDAGGEFVAWVRALEIERFGVPVPDRQLLLAVPRRASPPSGRRTASAPRPAANATPTSPTPGCRPAPAAVYAQLAARSLAVAVDGGRRRRRTSERWRATRAG